VSAVPSGVARRPTPLARLELVGPLVVAAGIATILLRTHLGALPPHGRSLALAALTGSILIVSVTVPVARDRSRARIAPWVGLAVGVVGVIIAAIASGRPVRSPLVAWAVPLSVLAAVAEEALFRRVAYGWLARWGVPIAVLGSATMFALIHIPLYGVAVFPVDLGAGLLLSWQRWATGTWTVPAATHAMANVLATVLR
jgi:membrane protease YdiL (CAAX protease family)